MNLVHSLRPVIASNNQRRFIVALHVRSAQTMIRGICAGRPGRVTPLLDVANRSLFDYRRHPGWPATFGQLRAFRHRMCQEICRQMLARIADARNRLLQVDSTISSSHAHIRRHPAHTRHRRKRGFRPERKRARITRTGFAFPCLGTVYVGCGPQMPPISLAPYKNRCATVSMLVARKNLLLNLLQTRP